MEVRDLPAVSPLRFLRDAERGLRIARCETELQISRFLAAPLTLQIGKRGGLARKDAPYLSATVREECSWKETEKL